MMAFKMEIKKTNTSPYVLIDEENSYIQFEGESFLEDAISFFKEINDWLREYLHSDFTDLTFDCGMDYFNSSTTKQIYNMLRIMDRYAPGKDVVVNWIVKSPENDILIECGEDFREEMENLEFNIVISNS